MLIRDMMQLYAMKHESTDLMLILNDYVLDSRLNKDALNKKFLLDLGECRPYYNETTVLKYAIDNFFEINRINIKRLTDTVFSEYEMLRDYDMTTEEDIVDDRDTSDTETATRQRSDTQDTTVSENINRTFTENGTDTQENTVSAYNASTYQPRDKSATTHSAQNTDTENNGTTDNYEEAENETKNSNKRGTDDYIRDRDVREYGIKNGNTYQDLLEKERKLVKFNIYEWILNKLANEICLQVW